MAASSKTTTDAQSKPEKTGPKAGPGKAAQKPAPAVPPKSRVALRNPWFRTKEVFEEGPDGKLRKVTLQPRFDRHNPGKKPRTVRRDVEQGAPESTWTSIKRTQRVQSVERRRDIIDLQGKIAESTGARRLAMRTWLGVYRWALLNQLAFWAVLFIGVLFVPWIGVGTWAGWAMASVVLTGIKYLVFATVAVYNLLASVVVGAINLVGTVIVGGLERASLGILDFWNLPDTVCTGSGEDLDCSSRTFAYTVPEVDTEFPGFPSIDKPGKFDTRTGVEFILRTFGVVWNPVNKLADLFRGES